MLPILIKMKALIYNIDEGGLKSHSQYLSDAMKKLNFDISTSNKMDYRNYDVVHILFDYSLFHPFGLGIIPMLMRLKLNGKKVVLTFGVVQPKAGIYARNKFFTTIKKIVLPITHLLLNMFTDKMIVMLPYLKEILQKDYKTNKEKIKVIPVGMD